MKTESSAYQSYLVRLWRETPGQEWRVTLQDVMTRRHYNFSNLTLMYEFLSSQGEKFPCIDPHREEALFE